MQMMQIRTPGHALDALLAGAEFDENARIVLPNETPRDRLEYLAEAVRGKRIIHLGFCDHLPSLAQRRDALRARVAHCLGRTPTRSEPSSFRSIAER